MFAISPLTDFQALPTHMQVPCVGAHTQAHHREQADGQRSRAPRDISTLYSPLVHCQICRGEKEKGKMDMLLIMPTLTNFQKKLVNNNNKLCIY